MQQTIAITNINLFIVVKLPIIKINPRSDLIRRHRARWHQD